MKKGILFILPSLLGVIVFYLIPYVDVIRRSFSNPVTGSWAGVQNYKEIFENEAFILAMKNTFRFIGVCIPLLIVASFLVAVLARHTEWAYKKRAGLLIPMAIPVTSVALLWKTVFSQGGLLNGLLNVLGIEGPNWMNTGLAFSVLVFSYIWKNLGYCTILWIAGLLAIPKEIYEAAAVDGASKIKSLLYVTLPNLIPALFIITVLAIINSFKVFREAYLVAGDYPEQSIYMIQHLFNNWFRNLEIGKMSAGAVVNMLIFLIPVWAFWKIRESNNE